jgi:hypothetical protein
MSLPKTEQTPDDPNKLPPARKRRFKRLLIPHSADEQEAFVDEIAHRVSPSFDFFLISSLAGLVIGLGLWVDKPAIMILGVVLAPLMAPLVGISLGVITGATHFFWRNLGGFLIASSLVFLIGTLTGYAAASWENPTLTQAPLHTQMAWHHFVLLAFGAVQTTRALVRGKDHLLVASVALAYELYLPLTAAGFGWGSGEAALIWPDGLVVFGVHVAWAAIWGVLTLLVLGFRPLTLFGYTVGAVFALIGILLLIGLSAAGIAVGGEIAVPTSVPSATPTPSLTPSVTLTPVPPTRTPTRTAIPPTPTQTLTPSRTPTPSPTPIYAIVNTSEEYGGAYVRQAPGFDSQVLTSVLNGTVIEILNEEPQEQDDKFWLHVRALGEFEGWMLRSALTVATLTPTP